MQKKKKNVNGKRGECWLFLEEWIRQEEILRLHRK